MAVRYLVRKTRSWALVSDRCGKPEDYVRFPTSRLSSVDQSVAKLFFRAATGVRDLRSIGRCIRRGDGRMDAHEPKREQSLSVGSFGLHLRSRRSRRRMGSVEGSFEGRTSWFDNKIHLRVLGGQRSAKPWRQSSGASAHARSARQPILCDPRGPCCLMSWRSAHRPNCGRARYVAAMACARRRAADTVGRRSRLSVQIQATEDFRERQQASNRY